MLESTTCFKFPDWNVGKGKREREREREKSPVKCAHMKEGTEVVTESIAFCSFFLLFLLFLLSILLFLNRFPPDSEPFQKRKFVSMKLLMLHSHMRRVSVQMSQLESQNTHHPLLPTSLCHCCGYMPVDRASCRNLVADVATTELLHPAWCQREASSSLKCLTQSQSLKCSSSLSPTLQKQTVQRRSRTAPRTTVVKSPSRNLPVAYRLYQILLEPLEPSLSKNT